MTDDRKHMWAGELADEHPTEDAFDPSAALAAVGVSMPEEIEVQADEEEEPLELDQPITEASMNSPPVDLSAFETVAGNEAREHDSLESPPMLAPAPHEIAGFTTLDEFLASEDMKPTGNPKDAIGATKPDISLIPPAGLLFEAQAMMDGARKYGPYNWRSNPVLMRVYIAAAQRHLMQLLDGENYDPISTVHHVGHARACLGIIADALTTGNLIDDRPLPGAAGEMIRKFGEDGKFGE